MMHPLELWLVNCYFVLCENSTALLQCVIMVNCLITGGTATQTTVTMTTATTTTQPHHATTKTAVNDIITYTNATGHRACHTDNR